MNATNPYQSLPEFTRWSKSVSGVPMSNVDPVAGNFPFIVRQNDKIATAGSCFAQHIARHLGSQGFNYFVVEPGHPLLSLQPHFATSYNYGTYSARYGNIYTSRQLLQLIKRAYGEFTPNEKPWLNKENHLVDPLRPNIQPRGFASLEELYIDQQTHLKSVRRMFEDLDIFVFTLGLTEYWHRRDDGTALPICPGVNGGLYDPEEYGFNNLSVEDVFQDMSEFIEILKQRNPKAKIVLTVSPVPLAATAENRHVLVSTTYSKSVLRVASEMLIKKYEHVGYFPSYEIITGNYNRGSYYASNLRDVMENGVEHVMRLFIQHVTKSTPSKSDVVLKDSQSVDSFYENLGRVVQTVCEEALLDQTL